MTDDVTTLRAQLDDANQGLARLRSQTVQSLSGLVEDLRTATQANSGTVDHLAEIVGKLQRSVTGFQGALDHAVDTIMTELRSLPCRKGGGNGNVCEHDHRRGLEESDTIPPPSEGCEMEM